MSEPGMVRRTFTKIGRIFDTLRAFVGNLIFLILLLVVLVLLFSDDNIVEVPEGGALVLDIQGSVVEEFTQQEPFAALMGGNDIASETRLRDILLALEKVRQDDRINTVVLSLGDMTYASTAHSATIGSALEQVRNAGKHLVAAGNFYSQNQYYLASFANEVYMHSYGNLLLEGYSSFQLYFRDLLEKLDINIHIFRVGTYKAAVEPFIRSDMSPASREANVALIETLWQQYLQTVADNRNLGVASIRAYADNFHELLKSTNGDMARVALEQGLVDELLSADEIRSRLIEEVGQAQDTFRQIGFRSYIAEARAPINRATSKIAIIVARGPILMGEQPRGTVGSESIVKLIQQARTDSAVKAIVLRIDSPGGGAFASELIRQELELTQQSGKPVVASMAGIAASGGYWIAATADEIWAAPGTITGSIGIFGLFPTFEKSIGKLGISTDAVGTSLLSGAGNPLTGLQPELAEILQANIESGYRRFINLVARGRNMSPDAVDKIAQGRIWTGIDAQQLGLVDKLGDLDDAVAAAANLVGLDNYETQYIEKALSPKEQLIKQITENFASATGASQSFSPTPGIGKKLVMPIIESVNLLSRLNDPMHSYALCEMCRVHN